jgi:hypothetical protein
MNIVGPEEDIGGGLVEFSGIVNDTAMGIEAFVLGCRPCGKRVYV